MTSSAVPEPIRRYAVADCGGTHTRWEIWEGGVLQGSGELDSASTASRSEAESVKVYSELVAQLARHQSGPTHTVVATAAFDESNAQSLTDTFTALVAEHHYQGSIHITNDVIPLLFVDQYGTESVAGIIGTGSAFWSRDAQDRLGRVGGVEWVASDEGAAVDLGRRGMIAMVRGADGRDTPTSIAARAGYDDKRVLQLAREIAEDPRPKRLLAALSRPVIQAWTEDGDAVAGRIVNEAVADVEQALAAVARHLDQPAQATWVLCGGLVSGSIPYQRLILDACARASGGASDIRCVNNAMELLRVFASQGWAERLGTGYVATITS